MLLRLACRLTVRGSIATVFRFPTLLKEINHLLAAPDYLEAISGYLFRQFRICKSCVLWH